MRSVCSREVTRHAGEKFSAAVPGALELQGVWYMLLLMMMMCVSTPSNLYSDAMCRNTVEHDAEQKYGLESLFNQLIRKPPWLQSVLGESGTGPSQMWGQATFELCVCFVYLIVYRRATVDRRGGVQLLPVPFQKVNDDHGDAVSCSSSVV
ncbi:hypothetical protein F2P81_013105 [Scophthalmus maximus]|uniref:Uncharacterized protein n=1 Tax=Scophthalmus maximus TaxID=52904 RepID=A0A6A4SPY5_SCOMX|nr:hypothetical protein F2P81_013105 [Scophthalmus maximus]